MEPAPKKTMLGKITAIFALVLFAAVTIWINYQIKVNVQGGGHRSNGSVHEMGNVKVGQTAPDFSTLDLSNKMVSLSGYRGQKVVLLDFWATWCGPCRMEMVELQSLQNKLTNADFEILSLNQQEPSDQVRQFIKRKQYTFHVLLDDGAASAKYGVRGIPTLVLIDQHGLIQWLQVGYSPGTDDLESKIRSLTKK
jgi:peroxiredoxin